MSRMSYNPTSYIILIIALLFLSGCKKDGDEFAIKTYYINDSYLSFTLPESKNNIADEALSFLNSEDNKLSGNKGIMADKGAKFLKNKGLSDFVVNAGGYMYVSGKKSGKLFAVGIQDPNNSTLIANVIEVKNKGVATKIGGEKGSLASISVVADNAEQAGNFATDYSAMSVEDIKKVCEQNSTPTLIIDKNGKQDKLCGWDKLEIK